MNDLDQQPRSPLSRVSINGDKIRRIREAQGLTQLYIATVLGVTTDTVSRWENRRYPTVKWENAEKLAAALEVDPEEILEAEPAAPELEEVEQPPAPASAPPPRWRWQWLSFVGVPLLLALAFLFFQLLRPAPLPTITATRYLPHHTPAGQPFPVIIKVETAGNEAFSFILQETLPPGCQALRGEPPFSVPQGDGDSIKWITTAGPAPLFIAYLAMSGPEAHAGGGLDFAGTIKIDRRPGASQSIAGSHTVALAGHHWADGDGDNRIDDTEILTIYNSFQTLQDLGVDLDLIRQIWAGNGYRWDPDRQRYTVTNTHQEASP